MINKFTIALLAAMLITLATAIPNCPHPLRIVIQGGVKIPICDPITEPPLPTRRPSPRPSPRPRPFNGFVRIKSPSMYVKESDDGFLRGCADPRVYFLYARTIIGQPGSTITRNLGHIDYGSGKCDRTFIRKLGGIVSDRVPTNKIAVKVYVAIGIEEDDAGDSTVRRKVNEQLQTLRNILKDLETKNLSAFVINLALNNEALLNTQLKIPQIEKPSDGFLNLGHDFVGFNGLILVSGSNFPGHQPAVCSRKDFPVCVTRDMTKGLWVGGDFDDNEWRVDVNVDA